MVFLYSKKVPGLGCQSPLRGSTQLNIVHICIYFVSSVVFVDFLIKSSFKKKKKVKNKINFFFTYFYSKTCLFSFETSFVMY